MADVQHKLAAHIPRYPNKSNGKGSGQGMQSIRQRKLALDNMSGLPEKTQVDVPGLPENTQEYRSEAFRVVIVDGGAREWLNDAVISYFIREFIDVHSSTYNFDDQLFGSIFMAYKTNKCNLAKTHEAVRGITATFPYAKYTTIMIPECMDTHWSFVIMQNPVLAIDGLTPAILHVDSLQYHDTGRIERALCGYFRKEALQYFIREVNKAIVRTKGKLILPLSFANISKRSSPFQKQHTSGWVT
ncbi:unnamed protein product [Phytophthora fragariaefolia]|uniref:Unnamed protein product n=1 Tax=Phytophthora fragariaefolia TaxID=1490495 RepID=A0A9W7CQQ7_9STRA|nr:unnamed protein product [Phytophthora fragariaefolia]